jgi:hypothetical protein
MSERSERLCAWMMLPGLVFFGLAMIPGMHFVPPLSPKLDAEEIAAIYRANSTGMLAGSVLMMFGGAFLMPFCASVYSAVLRMGGQPRALAGTVLAASILTYTPLFLSSIFFGVAAFRPDRPPADVLWVAYFNFWVGLLSLPGALIPLFKTGPFAWDGLLAFWLPLVVFGIWGPVMIWAMQKTGPGSGKLA